MNKQNKIIVGVVALILALTIGYAIFSQSLNISGTAKAQGNLDIVFSEVGEISPHGTNTPTATITENGRKLELSEITLDYPTAYVDIPVTIVNNGTVDGILESITVENLETDDIKVSINGIENNQIVKIYKENDDTTKVKATVRVEWLDKTDSKTESVRDIVVTLNAKQFVKGVVTTSSSSDSFPVLTGSLGDNVTFTYDNGNISIDGTGDMSIGAVENGGYCDIASGEHEYCSLADELSIKYIETLNVSENEKIALLRAMQFLITGVSYEDYGAGTFDEFMSEVCGEWDEKLNETEKQNVSKIVSTIPIVKKITIQSGITSIRNEFFKSVKTSNITIPNTVNKVMTVLEDHWPRLFLFSHIDLVTIEDGTKILPRGLLTFGDGCQIGKITFPNDITKIEKQAISLPDNINQLTIPSKVETIENDAIDSFTVTTIINKTGKAFDWNGIIGGTSSTPFETGTATAYGRTITITNK